MTNFKTLLLVLLFALCLFAPVSTQATTFTFSNVSTAVPANFNLIIHKMNRTIGYDDNLKPFDVIIWDSSEGRKQTKSSTLTTTGGITVQAVGIAMKVYKDSDLTNYWLVPSDTTSPFLIGR